MIVVNKNPIVQEFFDELGLKLKPGKDFALKNFVYGLLVNERASIKNITENTIQGQNERQMNRAIHDLSAKCDELLTTNLKKLQEVPGLAIRSNGVIALDEHVIPKSGKNIEGVDYFHTSAGEKNILGLSMISTHYYGGAVEYPIDRDLYRRQQELEKWGKEHLYRPKNEIARALVRKYHNLGVPCTTWVMDAYFMTKENVKELTSLGYSYISKIKRNWVITFQRKRWSVSELYASVPEDEFEMVEVVNSKTKEKRYFSAATREVFVKKIGVHRLVFMREMEKSDTGELRKKYEDAWVCLVTNMLKESRKTIIQTYMKRWAIETSYRDDTQELHLNGCMWRNIEGQYCFITLVFLAYRLLIWAYRLGWFDPYGSRLKTLGKKREAFKRFHAEIFGEWITDLKNRCTSCQIAKVLYKLIYRVNVHNI
jgi:SRSO17 transposase